MAATPHTDGVSPRDRHTSTLRESPQTLLHDDEEAPEWKEDLSDMLPKPGETCDDRVTPEIHGNTLFHYRRRKLLYRHSDVFAGTIGVTPANVDPIGAIGAYRGHKVCLIGTSSTTICN